MSDRKSEFDALGISIVVFTYEPAETTIKFSKQYKVGYPILADVDAQIVKKIGILNTSYQPGDRAYGIPYPGIFLVDQHLLVNSKFSEQGYKNRPALDLVITAAIQMIKGS